MHEAVWVRDPKLPDNPPYKGFPFPGLDVLEVGPDGLPTKDDDDNYVVQAPAADPAPKKAAAKPRAAAKKSATATAGAETEEASK